MPSLLGLALATLHTRVRSPHPISALLTLLLPAARIEPLAIRLDPEMHGGKRAVPCRR